MKISFHGFLGKNHSWSLVQQNIARSMIKKGHVVHLCSTNGYDHFPADLLPNVKPLENNYDMQMSYTAMHNFKAQLSHGDRNRFAIWNYETTILPYGMAKCYKDCDLMLPSSHFSKDIFLANGIPDASLVVVPHGADLDSFERAEPYKLRTKKKVKILANIAQPHIRKNIYGLLESFGRAFSKSDDVCLVVKISKQKKDDRKGAFDVNFDDILTKFKRRHEKHADIEIIDHFIPEIASLYKSCDATFSTTFAECFWLPGIESMAAGNITIAPRSGGQLDFMNDENSLLIPGSIQPAPKAMQYWTSSPHAGMFEPDMGETVKLLQKTYTECDDLKEKFRPGMKKAIEKFNWDKVADQIIGLCK